MNRYARRSTSHGFPSPLMLGLIVLAIYAPDAIAAAPNDPSLALQWSADNSGQLIPTQEAGEVLGPPAGGTPGADEHTLEAWGVSTGSRSVVIGEVDTGVDYNHPELAANIWTNPGGVGGCPAGTHGFNLVEVSSSCDPLDTEGLENEGYGGHGTHVAGIMGAVGDNGVGVAGVNWQSTILPVKWLSSANAQTSKLPEALERLVEAKRAGVNVRVINDSSTFKETGESTELKQAIELLGKENILFVTSAGNRGENNDEPAVLRYPCKYNLPNEICVTSSNNEDRLPDWANFGKATVDLAAPGVSIYSTLRGGKYNYLSGGSMAAAQVSGAAALILSVRPALSAAELKAAILNNVDRLPTFEGKVRTGGRLDVAKALPGAVTSVSPSAGLTAGGSSVTISGANLSRVTAVEFGASNAASFTITSSTSITAISPPGAGTVDMAVTSPAGTSAVVSGDRFSYQAAPPPQAPPGSTPVTASTQTPGQTSQTPAQISVLATVDRSSAVAIVSRTLNVRGGRTAIKLRCLGQGDCTSKLYLRVEVQTRTRGRAPKTRFLTVAEGSFSLRAGGTGSFRVRLSRAGQALLRDSRHGLRSSLMIPRSARGPTTDLVSNVRLLAR